MTSCGTDLVVVGEGPGESRRRTHARGLSVIVAEPRRESHRQGVLARG